MHRWWKIHGKFLRCPLSTFCVIWFGGAFLWRKINQWRVFEIEVGPEYVQIPGQPFAYYHKVLRFIGGEIVWIHAGRASNFTLDTSWSINFICTQHFVKRNITNGDSWESWLLNTVGFSIFFPFDDTIAAKKHSRTTCCGRCASVTLSPQGFACLLALEQWKSLMTQRSEFS